MIKNIAAILVMSQGLKLSLMILTFNDINSPINVYRDIEKIATYKRKS